jgi:hypothetical protein
MTDLNYLIDFELGSGRRELRLGAFLSGGEEHEETALATIHNSRGIWIDPDYRTSSNATGGYSADREILPVPYL